MYQHSKLCLHKLRSKRVLLDFAAGRACLRLHRFRIRFSPGFVLGSKFLASSLFILLGLLSRILVLAYLEGVSDHGLLCFTGAVMPVGVRLGKQQ